MEISWRTGVSLWFTGPMPWFSHSCSISTLSLPPANPGSWPAPEDPSASQLPGAVGQSYLCWAKGTARPRETVGAPTFELAGVSLSSQRRTGAMLVPKGSSVSIVAGLRTIPPNPLAT